MKKVNHPTSKRFSAAAKLVEKNQAYTLAEAIELIKKTSTVKFNASVEAHLSLNIDLKKSEQQVRNTVSLPNGTGKKIKIAVITPESDQQKAAAGAGAEIVGDKELVEEIKKGKINFDVLVSTPDGMKLLASAAKILGPKGLMPNPKDGTVTNNISETVANLKKGKVSFKNDDSGNLHVLIGKTSFTGEQLAENFRALLDAVNKAKSSSVKGIFIKSIYLASSMGPSVKVSL